ncbi:MAG: hypothetical protein ABIV11_10340 [Gemmatimonadaceae bacterium]
MESYRKVRIGLSYVGTAAAVFLVLGASAGCSNPSGMNTQRFVIAVDSISVPDTIAPSDTLTARFFGKIGPNQCFRLDRVERGRGGGLLELRFHGERNEDGDCLQMPAVLDHVEEVLPPVEDPFRIRVLQPDGSALEKVVRVR